MTHSLLWMLFWLITKHLIVDFPLQGPYQYKNKGTFGHMGGIVHSGAHAFATFAIMINFDMFVGMAVGIALAEFVIHYLIDWTKMNLNILLNYGPTTCEEFWWLLGLDQYCHYITYLAILYYVYW